MSTVPLNFHFIKESIFAQSSKNVSGVMVISNEGIPLKTTLDNSTTVQV